MRENRKLYSAKFDLADQIIGDRYGYRRPAGGFFLWLDVSQYGGSEIVTKRLWQEAGVRVVPGRYLAREQADGSNPPCGNVRPATDIGMPCTALSASVFPQPDDIFVRSSDESQTVSAPRPKPGQRAQENRTAEDCPAFHGCSLVKFDYPDYHSDRETNIAR